MNPKRAPRDRLGPPEWADRLIRSVVPPQAEPDSIIGDLRQEFDEALGTRSTSRLRFSYAVRAIEIALRYWRKGAARRRGESGGEIMSSFWSDVKYGVRMLVRTPLLTVTGALTIALGVALTTHAFSTIYGSMIRPPSADPDGRMRVVLERNTIRGFRNMSVPIGDYVRLRDQQSSFEELAGFWTGSANIAGDEAPPEQIQAAYGTANLLRVAGVRPLLGRVHSDGEDGSGSPRLAVLGHSVWQNRFGADPQIVGRTVRLNSIAYEVIGVMPEGFRFPFMEDVWLTHQMDHTQIAPRNGRMEVVGRLNPGVSDDAALSELAAITRRTVEEFPETHEGIGIQMTTYVERFMPAEVRGVLWLMMGAVIGVLLIACANVANLLLARAAIRGREVAIRTAMGANRMRVIRQLLVESALLGFVGGLIGLALAWVGLVLFNNAIVDIQKPYWIDIRIDGAALAFALLITLGAAIVAGTVPAIRASGQGIGAIIRDESRGSSSFRLGKFSTLLVVGELAISCALLVGAGLMIRSIVNLRSMDMGFESAGVMTAMVRIPSAEYSTVESQDQFWGELLERLEEEPGVQSATLEAFSPGTGAFEWTIGLEGEAYATDNDYPVTNGHYVSSGYFETHEIPILQGRGFLPSEWRLDGEPVIVVSETFAAQHYPDGDVLGKRLRLGSSASQWPWMRIVGVVGDVFTGSGDIGGLGSGTVTADHAYTPLMRHRPLGAVFSVKTSGDPRPLADRARQVVMSIDSNLPIFNVGTHDEALEVVNWSFGLFGTLFAIFGVAALFLASVGLYGVMASSVARRRREMGVRMALGAEPRRIVALVLRRGIVQLVLGAGIGLGLGAALSQPMRIALLGVDPMDPLIYATIALTLGGTGLIATVVPALRATRVDPNTALRPE